MEEEIKLKKQIKNVWKLSIPAILTQITSIIMQYIDSAMVGALGADASAAIGLVSTSTWLFGGLVTATSIGYSVQIAHACGAKDYPHARKVLRHGLVVSMIASIILLLIGSLISVPLPMILRADQSIWTDASLYFLVFSLSLPFMQLNSISSMSLQCSGNMIIPSILNSSMCLLDVLFNAIFIPRFGVLGAAIGTSLATVVISIIMFYFCCFFKKELRLTNKDYTKFDKSIILRALKIGTPVGVEQAAISGAMVVSTFILAPVGNISIAANSFAVTAESLCYMPAFGMGSAATTLVGQEIGAGNYNLSKRYANLSVILGTSLMLVMSIIMFIICPFVFKMLTPDQSVQDMAVTVLRIGMIAEPLYGVSIIASGALRGALDTLVPSIMNLCSIWIVRLSLSFILVGSLGLVGIWIANSVELSFRGIIMFIRLKTSKHFVRIKNEIVID